MIPLAQDSLESRVNSAYNEQAGQGSKNTATHKASSIDDVVEKEVKKDRFRLGRFIFDIAKFAPYAYLIWRSVKGVFTPLMTIGGFILGNLYESWRNKTRVSYKTMRKDIKTAGFLGAADYWFWTIPDIIPNVTLLGKIAKTLFAVPVLGMPYLYAYNHSLNLRETYIKLREENGFLSTFFKFVPKVPSYIKNFHKQAAKNSIKQMKQLLWIWPTYFIGFNFLTNIYQRIGVSVFNNMILRIITGKKKEPKYSKKAEAPKNTKYGAPKYSPEYSPSYG